MARRPAYRREPQDFAPGQIGIWNPTPEQRAKVAARARYVGSGEHKSYHSPDGEWIPAVRSDKAKCWRFSRENWPRIQEALRAAIMAPCVQPAIAGDFPRRVWFYINDVLHEARLSNREQGWYHGFPVESPEQHPADPEKLIGNAPRVHIPVLD